QDMPSSSERAAVTVMISSGVQVTVVTGCSLPVRGSRLRPPSSGRGRGLPEVSLRDWTLRGMPGGGGALGTGCSRGTGGGGADLLFQPGVEGLAVAADLVPGLVCGVVALVVSVRVGGGGSAGDHTDGVNDPAGQEHLSG